MNRRQRGLLLRTLLFLFLLNSFSIFLYFLLHPRPHQPHQQQPEEKTEQILTSTESSFSLKPWPVLPSFLPWNLTAFPPARSCEAFFGNGFSQSVSPLNGRSGFFRCHYSETLGSSICEGGPMRMDPDKIAMSKGGEELKEVMGRKEEDELPKYDIGAFQIEQGEVWERHEDRKMVDQAFLDRYLQPGAVMTHTMRALVESITVAPPGRLQCDQWIEDPTLMVTRFEYANMFHTVTDWYSAYVSARITNLPFRPHVIFLDGHCKTQLEETWEALFSTIRYAKNFTGTVCFSHVILSPLGYETALFKGLTEPFSCEGSLSHHLFQNPNPQKTSRLAEFGEMLLSSFDLSQNPNPNSKTLNILFVRREDYLAHPRHNGRVESRLSNELEIFDLVNSWSKRSKNNMKCELRVINGLFGHMRMREQLNEIRKADIVIGAHGAGLTHLVSVKPGTIVLEIISSLYRRPHFELISRWRGLKYKAIHLAGSHANPDEVIDELSGIVEELGCL